MKRVIQFVATLSSVGVMTVCSLAQAEVRCDIRANLLDTDPSGTNIRTGASKSSAVIGNLPAQRTDSVLVVGSRGPWVRISKGLDEDGQVIVSKGGWVFASLLGMSVSWNPDDKLKKGNYDLYPQASKKGPVIARIPPETGVTLVGCSGKWARIKYGGKTGWLQPEAQCTNTRTSCS